MMALDAVALGLMFTLEGPPKALYGVWVGSRRAYWSQRLTALLSQEERLRASMGAMWRLATRLSQRDDVIRYGLW